MVRSAMRVASVEPYTLALPVHDEPPMLEER